MNCLECGKAQCTEHRRHAVPDMSVDLKAIRARVARAAPGPWEAGGDDDSADGRMFVHDTRGHALFDSYVAGWSDVDFAAHARQDIPALLDHVESLTRQLEKARQITSDLAELNGECAQRGKARAQLAEVERERDEMRISAKPTRSGERLTLYAVPTADAELTCIVCRRDGCTLELRTSPAHSGGPIISGVHRACYERYASADDAGAAGEAGVASIRGRGVGPEHR